MSLSTADVTDLVKSKIKDLPPLPVVVQKLVKTLEDDNSSADDVMKVLSSDQALASKVLKLVNSSFYGMSGEISTPSRAVVILGFAAIRNLALGLSVAKFMSLGKDSEHMQRFWDHSITAAAACQLLAKRTGYPDPEEAFIAGLLHDIGQMVLNIAVPQEFARVIADGPEKIMANENEFIGFGHAKAGQMLLKHWKLPRNLSSAVRFHHNPKVYCGTEDPLVSLVALADAFANVHGSVYERSITTAEFQDLLDATGLPVAEVGEILHELDTSIEETRTFLQIATDEDVDAPAVATASDATVVMISTDQTRVTWTREVLGYYDMGTMSMKEFFSNPDADNQVDFVILDTSSITPEQLQKMAPRLSAAPLNVVTFDGDQAAGAEQCLGRKLPRLPLAFSRSDFACSA